MSGILRNKTAAPCVEEGIRYGVGNLPDHGRETPILSMKAIRLVLTIPGPADAVWSAWTTSEGLATFFAPQALVELWPGGKFELYFRPDAPAGSRGSEGCRIQTFVPGTLLAFEWNAPPRFPTVRLRKTWVVVQFQALGLVATRVTLTHLGWGDGPEWEAAHQYFRRSWGVVLARLEHRFESGPFQWNPPGIGSGESRS
jgi:uncharacterized protein YndB with AHSA1/START domain